MDAQDCEESAQPEDLVACDEQMTKCARLLDTGLEAYVGHEYDVGLPTVYPDDRFPSKLSDSLSTADSYRAEAKQAFQVNRFRIST